MDPTENLHSLHEHEEKLRAQSLEAIKADGALTDHLNIVSEAMNLIYAFSHDYQHQSDNELTLQMLGIRLFNAAGASVKLALSGYYQKAFDQVRDVLETYFLVDYLTTYPAKIAEWKVADKKARIAHFGPRFIRNALDKRDGYTSGARKKIYDLISEYASHASYPGFSLVLNDKNLGEVGFVSDANGQAVASRTTRGEHNVLDRPAWTGHPDRRSCPPRRAGKCTGQLPPLSLVRAVQPAWGPHKLPLLHFRAMPARS